MENDNIASIETINIGRLEDGESGELARLFTTAQHDGVFYLDLSDCRYKTIFDAIDNVFAFSKELFGLSEEEKLEYDVDKLSKLKING